MVTEDSEAERRAEIWLQDLWAGRESAEFALPPSRLSLALGDVVGLTVNGRRRLIEIQEISDTESRAVRALSIDPEVFDLALAPPSRRAGAAPPAIGPVHAQLLDLPTLRTEQPPVLSRIASADEITCVLQATSGLSGGSGLSRSSTRGMPRAFAARQIGMEMLV